MGKGSVVKIMVIAILLASTIDVIDFTTTKQELRRKLEESNKMLAVTRVLMERYKEGVALLIVKCGDRCLDN